MPTCLLSNPKPVDHPALSIEQPTGRSDRSDDCTQHIVPTSARHCIAGGPCHDAVFSRDRVALQCIVQTLAIYVCDYFSIDYRRGRLGVAVLSR